MSLAGIVAAGLRNARGLLILAGIGALSVGAFLLAANWPALHEMPSVSAPIAVDCDLAQRPCEVQFSEGPRIRLEVQPRNPAPMQPFRVVVQLDGLDAEQVAMDFHGVSMNMGWIQTNLQMGPDRQYVGETILPVCVRQRMDWEARVLVTADTKRWIATFPLITEVRR